MSKVFLRTARRAANLPREEADSAEEGEEVGKAQKFEEGQGSY